ncbi:hypothetical protein [Trinickia violacea]|uniref:hypothetical protein n=1 Tax=Trinickia violacea TaxID=2571746 RepID=UPI00158680B3|nr:hypothetical protein [Trinickia violacea]
MNKHRPEKRDASLDPDRGYHAGQRDALGHALNAVQQALTVEQARRAIKTLLADVKVRQ